MRGLLLLIGTAAALAGCQGGGEGAADAPQPGAVAVVSVTPAELALNVGDSRQLAATLRDASGGPLLGKAITWSSGDASKVTVAADGTVHALATGTVSVTATAEGKSAAAKVVVLAPPVTVDRVSLDVVSESIEEGSSLQLTATAFDAANNVIAGRGVRWSSSDADTASVEVDGRVTALRAGVVSITATIDGRSAAATLRVLSSYAFDLLYTAADVAAADALYVLDLNDPAGVPIPVFPPGKHASHGTPSPDGTRIAFVVYGEQSGNTWPSAIYVADRNGADAERVFANDARNAEPAWSPDGRQIAFSSQLLGGAADIWVMDADGSDAANLTADQPNSSERSPAWSPSLGDDGYRIAYSLEAGGTSHVWTMRADGSDKQAVTASADHFDREPAWSPDGSTLVFQRSGAATFGSLYLVSRTGGPVRALMSSRTFVNGQFGPAWSPDGRVVAFTAKPLGAEHEQVWTVWADGTRLARRTSEAKIHADSAWIRKP